MHNSTKVRFAPSPTGPLHIGGVRTLLYNYLLAKKTGGCLILRIEDTDQKRFSPSGQAYILESLEWLGLVPDQGPTQGGPYAPYKQSERLPLYQHYIQPLLAAGHAYYAFDTPEEIETMRQRLREAKITNPQYNTVSRQWMKNDLTLPKAQVEEWIAEGKPYVIRLKTPHKEWIRFYDKLRGWVKVESSALDDKVLMKSDGLPTYHFANVVDDYLMQITHIIRGEEWLPSTPIHILLYRYLGWLDYMPQFIHLPLLLAPTGSGKLSKRHADQYGFPAFPIAWHASDFTVEKGFREEGYLPETLWNFLALLGWSPGTQQEVFTQQELIEAFSLEKLGKSSVKFDITKAKWFNQQHIKKKGATVWSDYFIAEALKENVACSPQQAKAICQLLKDKVHFPKDFWDEGKIFLLDPVEYDPVLLSQKWNPAAREIMLSFQKMISTLELWTHLNLKQLLQTALSHQNSTMAAFLPLLRMALTGRCMGADLIQIILLLGKEPTLKRIETFLQKVDPEAKEPF